MQCWTQPFFIFLLGLLLSDLVKAVTEGVILHSFDSSLCLLVVIFQLISPEALSVTSNNSYSLYLVLHAEGIKCVKNVTIHTAPILSINAGEQWLGVGAADNSMSLFQRPQERLGVPNTGSKMSGWQLYRTPQKTNAVVYAFIFPISMCGCWFLLLLMHFFGGNLQLMVHN